MTTATRNPELLSQIVGLDYVLTDADKREYALMIADKLRAMYRATINSDRLSGAENLLLLDAVDALELCYE